jgi:glycine hydroxymethyltransferase
MKESEMVTIADLIVKVLDSPENSETINHVRDKVKALCKKYPVYKDIEV